MLDSFIGVGRFYMGFELITYKGKTIIHNDFRETKSNEEMMIQILNQEKEYIVKQPDKSVLILSNFSGIHATRNFLDENQKVGKFLRSSKMKKSALVGIVGVQYIFVRAYATFTGLGNIIKIFSTEEEAKEWLISD
jgi:hypothetical protein